MRRSFVLLALVACAAAGAQPPVGFSNWKFDELKLTNGAKFQGMILAEHSDGIDFRTVMRLPGRPTVTLTTYFPKGEVADVKRLTRDERRALKEKLDELDPNGEGERKRMESLELVAAEWPDKPAGARRYESEYFALVCTGSEELTRRSAARLEQMYTAFAHVLPPTVKNARPTTLMLATDAREYRALLRARGAGDVLNPAVFDPRTNHVLCGSDLTPLGSELQAAQVHHAEQLAGLDRYEASLRKLYKGEELQRHLKGIAAERKRVFAADAGNGAKFDEATARLFALLYHEAFHAYVSAFVYPPLPPEKVRAGAGTGELPRWLNEGLAQMFETAVVEAGEMRADHPDGERLQRAKDWLKGKNGGKLVPLGDLLVVGRDAFLASHADQKAASDRAYLSSWALAYYLTFERRVIGTPAFRKYLVAVNGGGDPKAAFADLVGTDLPTFEKAWHSYLLRLRPNGTVEK